MRRALLTIAMMTASVPCHAGEAAGAAHYIRLDVRAFAGGASRAVDRGDLIFRSDIVQTGAESSAVLAFNNKSTISIGPLSQVKIDGFTMGEDDQPKLVELVRGAFRFMSAPRGGAHSYEVKTPHATISVRGTTFDVRILNSSTTIVLHEGAINVCKIECKSIKPGTGIEVNTRGFGPVTNIQSSQWTFGATANQYIDPITFKPSRLTTTVPNAVAREVKAGGSETEPTNHRSKKEKIGIAPLVTNSPQTVQRGSGWISVQSGPK